jgi:hypothetical protein
MGKNPSFPFYPADWTRDLDDLDIQIEGAWIRIVCRLWWASPIGTANKPLKEWSRILRKTERKTIEILKILIEKGVASGCVLDNQNITITSRRMRRSSELSELRRKVGSLGGNPELTKSKINLDNQTTNQKQPSSSSSSKKKKIYTVSFLNFWSIYPRKEGTSKLKAFEAWDKLNGKEENLIPIIMAAIERQSNSIYKGKDFKYIPHPATWLNEKRWEGEDQIVSNPNSLRKALF